jgi:MarR family transcriptional regulator, organic hydroperoxide resistance regulator
MSRSSEALATSHGNSKNHRKLPLQMPDTPSPDRIYFRFIRLHQRVFGEMTQTLKPTGLSIPQFDVLSTLTEQEGLTQSDLAERLYVTKGNVSGLIDRLVSAQYVERRHAPGDRRSNALFLTDMGRKVAEQGIVLQKAFVMGQLSAADLRQLDGLISEWRGAIRQRSEQR